MRQLSNKEVSSVAGSGYWVDYCNFWGCTSTYVYEEAYISGYWLPEEWIDVCYDDGVCVSTYYPAEWVPGYWYTF